MKTNMKVIALLTATFTLGCAGVAPGDEVDPTVGPIDSPRPSSEEDGPSLIDPDCSDTAALQTPPGAGLAPAARITSMRLPNSMREATEMGCPLVAGSKGGQGLTALMRTMQIDADALVTPDPSGVIPSIILGHLSGWEVGESGNQTTRVDLRMYKGTAGGGDTFHIDPTSMDPDGGSQVHFPATVGCQALETEPGRIDFAVPVESAEVPLTLEASQVSGQISIDQTGFNITQGLIVGYVPFEAIVSIVSGVQTACRAPDAPTACAGAGVLLQGDAEEISRTLVLPFLYGLDARLSPDLRTAEPCNGDDCNAMSVCIGFEAHSVNIPSP